MTVNLHHDYNTGLTFIFDTNLEVLTVHDNRNQACVFDMKHAERTATKMLGLRETKRFVEEAILPAFDLSNEHKLNLVKIVLEVTHMDIPSFNLTATFVINAETRTIPYSTVINYFNDRNVMFDFEA